MSSKQTKAQQARSPIEEILKEAESLDYSAAAGSRARPLDDLFARGRRQLRALSTDSNATTKATSSSRYGLERQLQEWRKEDAAKRRQGNTGLLVPPRMSLDMLDDHRDASRLLPAPPLATRLDLGFASVANGAEEARDSGYGISRCAVDRTARLNGAGLLSSGMTASAPVLPTFNSLTDRGLSTPPRIQVASPLSAVWPSNEHLSSTRASESWCVNNPFQDDPLGTPTASRSSAANTGGHEEVAALRRYLAAVQTEVADRDRQLRELVTQEHPHADGETGADVITGDELQEWIQREEEEVRNLEAALAQTDSRIREGEEQLDAVLHSGESRGASNFSATAADSGGLLMEQAPSLASTAPTGPLSVEQVWQDRAKALERDIRSESAQALELQDRIHWLRMQLRRQPNAQDDRVAGIQDLFEQIRGKLEHLNGSTEVATIESSALPGSLVQRSQLY